jgi:hypothetical protein
MREVRILAVACARRFRNAAFSWPYGVPLAK